MNIKNALLTTLALLCPLSLWCPAQEPSLTSFNDNWLFSLSDSSAYTLHTFRPDDWRKLTLPHDWTIEQDFSEELEGCTAFMPGGIGWYYKLFQTPIKKNQKCFIIFDGVYNNADYWVNGMKLGNHPYGYAPTYFDLTNFLAPPNQSNKICIRVDRSRYADSRWYTGSGIYRNVHLLVVDKLHIPVWGIFVTTPEVTRKHAIVDVQVEVENAYESPQAGTIISDLFDPNGKKIATARTSVDLLAQGNSILKQQFRVAKPQLWGIDSPELYRLETRVSAAGKTLEQRQTRFGIRSFRFDKDHGFFLNGNNIKIKGVCLHHDAGLVGAAVPKDVWKRRLQLLKAAGCNAIRSAHNPASDEFLDLCDEMGFLVQNEFYDEWDLPKDKRFNMHEIEVDYITRGHAQHFQLWAERDLKNTIRSSRNHPSIFQWSIGNEIEWTYPGTPEATGIFKKPTVDGEWDWSLWRTPEPPHTPQQVQQFWDNYPQQSFNIGQTARKLASWTRELDTTRPVTANCILPTSSFETGYTDALDVVGLSYKSQKYDYFKRTYPHKVMMGTENVPRWYEWKAALERPSIAGVFLWTGVDYLGECTQEHWPVKATPHGPLDLAGFPRGSYYMFKSLWREDEAVLALYSQTVDKSIFQVNVDGKATEKKPNGWKLAPRPWQAVNPHWNYVEGDQTIVEAYSNCEAVELFQDGRSLGKQYLRDHADRVYKWPVNFTAGKLVAIGMKARESITRSLETAGEPVAIRLSTDREAMTANNADVVHVVAQLLDARGREVKHTDREITFAVSGEHRFLGTDCGNTAKMKGFKHKTVSTEFGKCLMIVQSTKQPSLLKITASADGGGIASNEARVRIE